MLFSIYLWSFSQSWENVGNILNLGFVTVLLLVHPSWSPAWGARYPCLRSAASGDAGHSTRKTVPQGYCERAPCKKIAWQGLFNLIKTMKGLFMVSWLNELFHKITDAGESTSSSTMVNTQAGGGCCCRSLVALGDADGAWWWETGRGQERQKDGKDEGSAVASGAGSLPVLTLLGVGVPDHCKRTSLGLAGWERNKILAT